MKVEFLPVNQRWVLLFGDSIIDLDGERSFGSLVDLKFMLRCKGLKVVGRKVIAAGHSFNPAGDE